MILGNWLVCYGDFIGLKNALKGITLRRMLKADLTRALKPLKENELLFTEIALNFLNKLFKKHA